jgi:hypothetical protein
LRPPTEFESIHARIVKGIAATEKYLNALDVFVQKAASGEITLENGENSPEYQAVLAIQNDTAVAADVADYTAAVAELEGKGTTDTGNTSTLTAAEYKSQATQYLTAYDAVFSEDLSTSMADLGSTDPQAQAAAQAVFETFTSSTRAAMAKIADLKPPTEYESIHARLKAGLDANETILQALETYVSTVMASGGDSDAVAAAEQAYGEAVSDPAIAAAMTDFDAARAELASGSGGTVPTP